jgi:hypothetical protein
MRLTHAPALRSVPAQEETKMNAHLIYWLDETSLA